MIINAQPDCAILLLQPQWGKRTTFQIHRLNGITQFPTTSLSEGWIHLGYYLGAVYYDLQLWCVHSPNLLTQNRVSQWFSFSTFQTGESVRSKEGSRPNQVSWCYCTRQLLWQFERLLLCHCLDSQQMLTVKLTMLRGLVYTYRFALQSGTISARVHISSAFPAISNGKKMFNSMYPR